MKKILFFIITVFILAGAGCSSKNTKPLDSLESKKILLKHIELKGTHYELNLSEKKALRLGINKEEYLFRVSEIEQVNKKIEEALKEPNTKVELIDFKTQETFMYDVEKKKLVPVKNAK